MALYLGDKKVKINTDKVLYTLNLHSETPIVNEVMLLSADRHILKDFNGLFVTSRKESE